MEFGLHIAVLALVAASPALAAGAVSATLLPGVFSNEEQVRAQGTAGAAWASIRITPAPGGFDVQPIDAFGTASAPAMRWLVRETADRVRLVSGGCVRDFAQVPAGFTIINQRGGCPGRMALTTATDRGLGMVDAEGRALEMARARGFACTVGGAVLPVHDAGGRAVIPGHVLLLRHVPFPHGDGIAALKLSILPEAGETPLATAVAEAPATRIGVSVPGIDAICRLGEPLQIPG